MTAFPSSSALCTLTVSTPVLEKDIVLLLVTTLASSKQLTIKKQKKGASCELELHSGHVLSQRNAILRALAGPVLHYALDTKLTGGYGAASRAGGSYAATMALSSLHHWMTVADQVRLDASSKKADLLPTLESHLDQHAFLIPSSQATLADYDVASLFFQEESLTPNVQRWVETVYHQMKDIMGDTLTVDATSLLHKSTTAPPVPMFFDGTEPFLAASSGSTNKKQKGAAAAASGPGGVTEEQKKAAADKKAAKNAAKAAKKPKAATPAATADWNISALDIRVGKIVKAWPHAEAEKLYCEEIDLGEESGPRQIASGLRNFYSQASDLEGKLVLVLANLKKRNLVGFPSHGMVLCASNADHTKVELIQPPAGAVVGERISFESIDGPAEPENKVAKKKLVELLIPNLLVTNATGQVVWGKEQQHVAQTSAGPIINANMPNAQVA